MTCTDHAVLLLPLRNMYDLGLESSPKSFIFTSRTTTSSVTCSRLLDFSTKSWECQFLMSHRVGSKQDRQSRIVSSKKSGLRHPSVTPSPRTKLKKSGLSHHYRLHVFKHTKRDCFPDRFYFNTNECIHTHRDKIQERPELPRPPYDPP